MVVGGGCCTCIVCGQVMGGCCSSSVGVAISPLVPFVVWGGLFVGGAIVCE